MTDFLMVGEVLKPQGLRGECKIRPCAADLSLFETWDTLFLPRGSAWDPIPCRVSRIHEGFVYAILGDCKTPEDVERLRGARLYVDRAHASPLEEGAHYIADLLGCLAVDESGAELGTLSDVLQNGPVDTWVFTGKRPFMAPALRRVFPEVDTEARRILVVKDALEEVAVFED
ncbi:MAG: 16S rRNA processing protein RimM [Clostridia bacterium]|nr:16S rRNA processing protein RimM [Clostridia bacterium]